MCYICGNAQRRHSLAGPRHSALLRDLLILNLLILLILLILRTLELLPERGHHLIAHRVLRRLRQQRGEAVQLAHCEQQLARVEARADVMRVGP
eukprot:scaffold54585_cov71-Phaeocystis_antarctica.AAC.4